MDVLVDDGYFGPADAAVRARCLASDLREEARRLVLLAEQAERHGQFLDSIAETVEDTSSGLSPVHSFSSAIPLIALADLRNDAKMLSEHTHLDTFWMDEGQDPRCSVEQVVKWLRYVDFSGGNKALGPAGAEYWVEIREPNTATELRLENDCHFFRKRGELHFPLLSTTTYLDNKGGSTIILDWSRDAGDKSFRPPIPQKCFVSHPAPGKHLVFPGNWYHACLDSCKRPGETKTEFDEPCEPEREEKSSLDQGCNRSDTERLSDECSVVLRVNWWARRPHLPQGKDLDDDLLHRLGLCLSERLTLPSISDTNTTCHLQTRCLGMSGPVRKLNLKLHGVRGKITGDPASPLTASVEVSGLQILNCNIPAEALRTEEHEAVERNDVGGSMITLLGNDGYAGTYMVDWSAEDGCLPRIEIQWSLSENSTTLRASPAPEQNSAKPKERTYVMRSLQEVAKQLTADIKVEPDDVTYPASPYTKKRHITSPSLEAKTLEWSTVDEESIVNQEEKQHAEIGGLPTIEMAFETIDKGRQLYALQQYKDAISVFRQALELAEKTFSAPCASANAQATAKIACSKLRALILSHIATCHLSFRPPRSKHLLMARELCEEVGQATWNRDAHTTINVHTHNPTNALCAPVNQIRYNSIIRRNASYIDRSNYAHHPYRSVDHVVRHCKPRCS